MTELREFARQSGEFEKLGVRLVPISVDDQQHAHDVWEKVANKKFTILSDPGAVVIKKYGLLHDAPEFAGAIGRSCRGSKIGSGGAPLPRYRALLLRNGPSSLGCMNTQAILQDQAVQKRTVY
jgi:hypothetical protein